MITYGSGFFFNDTATTEIYTLSLHDALPISPDDHASSGDPVHRRRVGRLRGRGELALDQRALGEEPGQEGRAAQEPGDRKSTRLNSSHANISYAVFCLKKKTSCIPSPSIPVP